MSSEGWSLTESDPGIFTGLLKELGVTGLEVEELWGLEQLPELSQQVITNACATLAILNATLNIDSPEVQLGDELSNLKSFSEGLDPETRGHVISNSEKVRTVHNSFARADPYHLEENRPQDEDEDAYHFISYLPIGDKLSVIPFFYDSRRFQYELDGLKSEPVCHGVIPGGKDNWPALAKQVLERRIATYPEGSVMFNLQAITSRSTHLASKIESLKAQVAAGESNDWVSTQLEEAEQQLAMIQERFKEWEVDNSLRRHNFIGLIHGLLLEMARQGKLEGGIEGAKDEMKRKIAAKKAKGEAMDVEMD
ncbi:ubiquitin carboxyl-terminal hydrolase L5 [Pseudohyphozyma bogoriensis]|nr:ubiquitin carboxyl-terminal hydrolase L5 [Pseudohyphozyma bogoriensis]